MIGNTENNYIALICEGKSEKFIVEKLLDNNLLIFSRDQLIDQKVLGGDFRNAEKFTKKYLTLGYDKKIKIVLVVDKKTKLNIKKIYAHNIEEQICIITRPEIEMLMIIAMDNFTDFQKVKTNKKPSVYMKELVKEIIKSEEYIEKFYSKYDLVRAIEEYHKVRPGKNEYSLKNLLKW